MAVGVALVAGLAGDFDEDKYYDVGDEVAERVHGVGEHGGAPPHEAGDELDHDEQGVDGGAHEIGRAHV